MPFDVAVFAVRLEDMLDDVLQSVGSYQASGSARVDDESVDSLAFYRECKRVVRFVVVDVLRTFVDRWFVGVIVVRLWSRR